MVPGTPASNSSAPGPSTFAKVWQEMDGDKNKTFCFVSHGQQPKRVSVEPFMGQWRVDIRKVRMEWSVFRFTFTLQNLIHSYRFVQMYYDETGSVKPTTKGVSLSMEEYRAVREVLTDGHIDEHAGRAPPPQLGTRRADAKDYIRISYP